MSQKIPSSLQSIKSLPVDFEFVGSPTSYPIEMSSPSRDVSSLSIPENGEARNEIVEEKESDVEDAEQANDESPYCANTLSVEDGLSMGDEDLDSAALPLTSISASRDSERRWSDTTSYAAKKVYFHLFLSYSLSSSIIGLRIHDLGSISVHSDDHPVSVSFVILL